MQHSKHYSKAPLTEAIIDLKVTIPDNVSIDTLASIHSSIESLFPTREEIFQSSIMVQPGSEVPVSTDQQLFGFIFRSDDKSKVFQITLNSFTFNRLAPYTSWEELRDDARRIWEIYRSIVKPDTVTRVGVRFVNRFDLPCTTSNLKDFLLIVPEIAADLPKKEVGSFFMQLLIPQEECQLVINEAIVPPTNPGMLSVILDFDLFREQTWKSDDDDIWQHLEKLRVIKNTVFEASITDKTRRLIDE